MTQRVLVTGASRGIGRSVVERLIARGATVAACATNEALLAELESELGVLPVAADLRVDAETIVPTVIRAFGGIDGFVSCAGIARHGPLLEMTSEAIDEHYRINVRAPLLLSRDVARDILSRKARGSIVHIASTLAMRGAAGCAVYAASKGAVVSMTKSLALELAPSVRVNCIAPGGVDTDMIAERRDVLAALHPLGRNGTTSEVAAAAMFLMDNEFATGTIMVLDGGLSA